MMNDPEYDPIFMFLNLLEILEKVFSNIPFGQRPFSDSFPEALVNYACDLMGASGVIALSDSEVPDNES